MIGSNDEDPVASCSPRLGRYPCLRPMKPLVVPSVPHLAQSGWVSLPLDQAMIVLVAIAHVRAQPGTMRTVSGTSRSP